MKRLILAVIVVLGLSELTPVRAQFVVGPVQPAGFGYSSSFAFRSGFGFSVNGSRVKVCGFAGGFVTRSAFIAPPVFASPFGYGPVGFAPVGFAPPFGFAPVGFAPVNPYWGGWGPAFGPPVIAVPVPVPVPVGIGGNFPDPNGPGFGGNIPPRDDRVLFPKGDFVVIAPRKDAPVARVEPVPIPLPLPKPPGPMIAFDPFKVPAPVKAEVPEADPKKEAARLIKLARESFVAGDYGRAAENFERATNANPADATTYFLHAQAKFAAGQYAEAVARIRDGLARDAKWPGAAFDPTELYGDRPERFVLHLLALKKANTDNPNQATLEFLLGYQLWFSGDKVEADKLFRAAEKRLAAPGPIALFK